MHSPPLPTNAPPSGPGRRRRLGAGMVLIVVFFLLMILAVWAFSMSFFSQSTTQQSARAQFRERCEELGRMAILETMHAIRIRVNDESERAIFDAFRMDNPPEMVFDIGQLAHTQVEMKRFPGYSIEEVTVRVPRRASIGVTAEERVPYEAVGVARVTVTAYGPEDARATLVEEYGFRSVLTAPPRPLDMLSFFLEDPTTLLTKGAYSNDPNLTIELLIKRMADQKRYYLDWVKPINDLADLAKQGIQIDGAYSQVETLLRSLSQEFQNAGTVGTGAGFYPVQEWTAVQPNEDSRAERTLHFFAAPICVYTAADTLDLSILDLPNKVEPELKYLFDQVDPPSQELHQVLQGFYQKYSGGTDHGAQTALADAQETQQKARENFQLVHGGARRMETVLEAYKTFEDSLIEVGGSELERIQKRLRRLASAEQPWRNHYRFYRQGAAAEAAAFLNRDPPPSGVVLIEDPDGTPLEVNLANLTGRLQIITRGDMVVQRATVANPSEDALILISYGALDVQGEVNAALISWGQRYESRGQDILGSLVLRGIPPTTSMPALSEMFSGTLTYQLAVRSGPPGNRQRPPPNPTSLHIAFSPIPPYRRPSRR